MRSPILSPHAGLSLSLRSKSRRHIFHPSFVPEIAAGYWWDTSAAVGLGTTGFKVPEGNGHSSFDLVQATVASQPTLLTEQGGQQFRMRKTGDSNPSRLATSSTVQAGWTGPTYIAGWMRLPDASGDVGTAGDSFLRHTAGVGNVRLAASFTNGTPDRMQIQPSNDGTTQATHLAGANSPTDGSWQWLEWILDFSLSLGGSSPADEVKFFSNFVQLTRSVSPSAAIGSVFNALSAIAVCCTSSAASNTDTTDFAMAIYAPGIPSRANRVKTANFRNPTGVLLAA